MFLELSRKHTETLIKQIYKGVVDKILNGELESHEKLPSTRSLAQDLGVSRIIILEVYDQLVAEGYVYTRKGSGTYVNEGVRYERKTNKLPGNDTRHELLYELPKGYISFRPGVPDLNSIPITKWAKLYKKVVYEAKPSQLDYQNSFGCYQLRRELVKYLNRMRGVRTEAKNIIITTGAAQAFSLLRFLINNNEYVLVENPCSIGLQKTLKTNGMTYKPIEIDHKGIIVKKLPSKPPKLIVTTPSHQFPTGVILPMKRRIELINYAKIHNCYIVEDDYDSEYRFEGNPIPSLQSIEPSRTIYVGTFSKTFSPAIRMGYMVLPDELVDTITGAKYGTDIHSPIFEQLTMARLISEGHLEKHIRKMKNRYASRRRFISMKLKEKFKENISISGDFSGLHLVVTINSPYVNMEELLRAFQDNKVEIWDINRFYLEGSNERDNKFLQYGTSLILGYGNCTEKEVVEGLERINQALFSLVFF